MLDNHLLKQLIYSELCHGKHTVGGQKKLFRDCLKAPSKTLTLMLPIGWQLFSKHATRSKITKGALAAEARQFTVAEQKQAKHNEAISISLHQHTVIPCASYGKEAIRLRLTFPATVSFTYCTDIMVILNHQKINNRITFLKYKQLLDGI